MKNKYLFIVGIIALLLCMAVMFTACNNNSNDTTSQPSQEEEVVDHVHTGYLFEGKAATTLESGWQTFWYCTDCNKAFLTQNVGNYTSVKASQMPTEYKPGPGHIAYLEKLKEDVHTHTGYHFEGKAATTTNSGWKEFWLCTDCQEVSLTEMKGQFTLVSAFQMTIKYKPTSNHIAYIEKIEEQPHVHTGYHFEGKAATTTESGWKEFWYCTDCQSTSLTELTGTFSSVTASQMTLTYKPTANHIAYLAPIANTYRGVLTKSNTSSLYCGSYDVSEGGTIIVDYKFADPKTNAEVGVSMFFGSDLNNCFGKYKIFHNKLEQTSYSGVTFTTLDDGYNRITLDVSKLNTTTNGNTAPTTIDKLLFKWFEATEGVYFDINPQNKTEKKTEFQMSGSKFVIANFTDIHVDTESLLSDSGTTGKTIKYGIANSNPDILVFSGDVVGSSSDLDYLCDYLDDFKIPYFIILGNHDHEGSLGYDTIAQRVNQSKYGYIEKGPDDLNYKGNYTIKIKNSDGELVHALIMMNTGNKYTVSSDSTLVEYVDNPISGVKYGTYKSKKTYCDPGWNGLRGNQIDWYEDTVESLNCDTTLICHIPFLEFCKAYEQYQDAVNKQDTSAIEACAPIGQCNMGEQICGSIENLGIFDKILELGSTKNVICGHDHLNDFSLLYQGVRLTYALKTGEGAYWKNDGARCGYTELTIDSTGQTSLDQIYYNPLS